MVNKNIIDSHIHTHYSHGKSEIYEIINYALNQGIDNIGFSEHFHYDFLDKSEIPTVNGRPVEGTLKNNFKMYYKTLERAKKEFKNKINIRIGVEVDYVIGKDNEIKTSLNEMPFINDYKEENPERKYDFDFIMGATHFIGEDLKYFSDYKQRGDDWMLNEYFNSLKQSIKSGLFNIIAHPELIKFYIDADEKYYNDKLDEITDLLKEYELAIDVNTDYMKGDYFNNIEKINPGILMLRMCKDKNIPLVLGSDAHQFNRIGNCFEEVKKIIKDIGIESLFYFQGKRPVEYEI